MERLSNLDEECKSQKETAKDVANKIADNYKSTKEKLAEFSSQTDEVIRTIEKNRDD